MLKTAASKVMWVGRATVFLVGLAVILALVVGMATMAFAANGNNFVLGVLNNSATAITKLTGNVSGKPALQVSNPNTGAGSKALQLDVAEGKAPLTVNATAGKATNLNSDKLDGLDSSEIGVNGWERVSVSSALNSDSPKAATATCPSGKVVVGTGYDIEGGRSGSSPTQRANVVIDTLVAFDSSSATHVFVEALEEEPVDFNWQVQAQAICATAGTP